MVKLICTDIDGTLLNKERTVDERTIQVFKQLDENIPIVLASSRMPKALWHIQQSLNIENQPLICYNGALTLSSGAAFDPEKVISSVTISGENVQEMLKTAQFHNLHISIFQNNTWLASAIDFYAEREINNTRVRPDGLLTDFSAEALAAFIANGAHKVMVMGKPELINLIEETLRTETELAIWRSKDIYLEITPHTNKSQGLTIILNQLPQFAGIKWENVMAFGDGHNDFELLKEAKFGVAVGNGVQQIKDVAYAISKTNIEHGVAEYVAGFFGLK
ncbi:MAG: Cof-type HAD-IIB family hydrolase [Mucilaginibacter sp.]|uniref:Cof-type HAD-IIB family hydrolase n=1 Tax=Mucilaginibacter sp. TaxID=1882438 RepID=UPI0034E402A1